MNTALMIRTVGPDMQSYNGFRWPESGPVECPDWDPAPACGNGLHGLIDGVGDYSLLSDEPDAKWLLVEIDRDEAVEINGKVKVPRGTVVYCGDMRGAMTRIALEWRRIAREAEGGSVTTGNSAHAASQGYSAHAASQGYSAHAASQGYRAHAIAAGPHSIAAVLGLWGTAEAGEHGTVILAYWDDAAERHRIVVGYVGEDGIEAGVRYRVDGGRLVPVSAGEARMVSAGELTGREIPRLVEPEETLACDATLRDVFAAHALNVVAAWVHHEGHFDREAVASDAWALADAMMAERVKRGEARCTHERRGPANGLPADSWTCLDCGAVGRPAKRGSKQASRPGGAVSRHKLWQVVGDPECGHIAVEDMDTAPAQLNDGEPWFALIDRDPVEVEPAKCTICERVVAEGSYLAICPSCERTARAHARHEQHRREWEAAGSPR